MARRWDLEQTIDDLLDDEKGTIFKDAPTRIALLYPSPYRVGMSSLGYQTIYRLLNLRDDVVAERAFLPDDPEAYRDSRTPLFTMESKIHVSEPDIIAVSVAYETEVLGLIESLDLSGIPLRATDRDERWPLVVFGGPLTFSNPLPVAPFCDVMVMGEGDELINVIIDAWHEAGSREELLADLAPLPGIYVPSIHGEKLVQVAQSSDAQLPAYSQIITPNTELSNMHLVENARGCHRGCTFCVMRRTTNGGMRTVSPEDVLATIPDYAERVGLVGAATSDHPEIKTIMRALVDRGLGMGLSSLRADRLDDEFVALLAAGGARTLTVASDGTSDRMRKVAKKGIKDKHLRRCAELVRDHDLKLLKLYMVIGYPEETEDDFHQMIEFIQELSEICDIALGMSPLVAKKNTPLDGSPFYDTKKLESTSSWCERNSAASWTSGPLRLDGRGSSINSPRAGGTWRRLPKKHGRRAALMARGNERSKRKGARWRPFVGPRPNVFRRVLCWPRKSYLLKLPSRRSLQFFVGQP
jgi:radical SAM superfamily enzyme YgiQ (UPF0313 family)